MTAWKQNTYKLRDLLRVYATDSDFGEFVELDEDEDLHDLFPGQTGKITVSGTPAPPAEPEPEQYGDAAPVAGAARTLTLLCHAEVVGTNGTKIKVEDVTTLAELVEKLRATAKIWEGMDYNPTAGTPLAVHSVEGSAVGAAYTSLDEVTDKSKICIKATASGAEDVEEAVPEVRLVVMVAKNAIVSENKKMLEVSVASVEELCNQMKVACNVTDANVAVFKVRGSVASVAVFHWGVCLTDRRGMSYRRVRG